MPALLIVIVISVIYVGLERVYSRTALQLAPLSRAVPCKTTAILRRGTLSLLHGSVTRENGMDWCIARARKLNLFVRESTGTVIRAGGVKMLEFEKEYSCTKCRTAVKVQAEFEQFYALPKPSR